MNTKPRKRRGYWIECYTCGCASQAHTKKNLTGYCSKHGNNVSARYFVMAEMPKDDDEEEEVFPTENQEQKANATPAIT